MTTPTPKHIAIADQFVAHHHETLTAAINIMRQTIHQNPQHIEIELAVTAAQLIEMCQTDDQFMADIIEKYVIALYELAKHQ